MVDFFFLRLLDAPFEGEVGFASVTSGLEGWECSGVVDGAVSVCGGNGVSEEGGPDGSLLGEGVSGGTCCGCSGADCSGVCAGVASCALQIIAQARTTAAARVDLIKNWMPILSVWTTEAASY